MLRENNADKIKTIGKSFKDILRDWGWEILAWTAASSALIAISILLVTFQHRPVDVWTSKIQLSAIVAALAQPAQSSLIVCVASSIGQLKWSWFKKESRSTIDLELFDKASRGPEGSLELIFQWPRFRLITVGALITILMLAFQTFIQQSLLTEVQKFPIDGKAAFIRRALIYHEPQTTPGGLTAFSQPPGESGWYGGNLPKLDSYIISAIKSGMYDEQRSLSNISTICPTGDCTWPSHNSMAVCTNFQDISHQLQWTNISMDLSPYPTKESPTLPDLASRPPWALSNTPRTDFYVTSLSYDDQFNRSTVRTSDGQMPDLAAIYVVFYDPCAGPEPKEEKEKAWQANYRKEGWKAFKGTLRLCIHDLDSSSEKGTVVRKEYNDAQWDVRYQSLYPPHINEQDNVFRNCSIGVPDCATLCTDLPGMNNINETFCIRDLELRGMGWQIANAFNTTASLRSQPHAIFFHDEMAQLLVTDIIGPFPRKCMQGPGLQFEGFMKRVKNVATSINNAMRTASSSTIVNGTAWESKPSYKLQPAWLAFPAVLYVAITGLLILTIAENRRSNAPVWKNSVLGLLRALDGDETGRAKSTMEKKARETTLQLNEVENVWVFEGDGISRDHVERIRTSIEKSSKSMDDYTQ